MVIKTWRRRLAEAAGGDAGANRGGNPVRATPWGCGAAERWKTAARALERHTRRLASSRVEYQPPACARRVRATATPLAKPSRQEAQESRP
jgi:hypothetical protein